MICPYCGRKFYVAAVSSLTTTNFYTHRKIFFENYFFIFSQEILDNGKYFIFYKFPDKSCFFCKKEKYFVPYADILSENGTVLASCSAVATDGL